MSRSFFFSSRRRHTRSKRDWSSDVCSSDLCSITGFGQDGPYAHRAGYDLLIQGMGGIMDLTGQPDGEPMRGGVAFADVMTGIYSALAITAALNERHTTGKGSYIDMALLDTQVGVLANQAASYLISGKAPKRMGNAHPAG